MKINNIFVEKKLVAIVISGKAKITSSTFFSPPDLNLQFGILKRPKGFQEVPHYHPHILRKIKRVEQFLYLTKGKMKVNFYNQRGRLEKSINLIKGDKIIIVDGVHSISIINDCEAISIKQGPFISEKADKVEIKI